MKTKTILTTRIAALIAAIPGFTGYSALISFDSVSLPPSGYDNGSSGHGGFLLNGVLFHNDYNTTYGSWSGFALSNINDPTTPGWGNQYAVAGSGTGYGGSGNYAVLFDGFMGEDFIQLGSEKAPQSMRVNNTAYVAQSMLQGDFVAKKFGGVSGTDPDWFRLTIRATDAADSPTGTPVEVYLADYRFTNSTDDYVLQDWQLVDLTPLGANVHKIHFDFASSDNGAWGMNTPAYVALDQFVVVPEPAVAGLMALGLLVLRRRRP